MPERAPSEEPLWITSATLHVLHDQQVTIFGGHHGVVDDNVIESTLARPIHKWHHEQMDIAGLAAAYLCGFAQKQEFIDGNKRTALVAALVFLEANGYEVDVPADELYALTLMVAHAELHESQIALWFRTRLMLGS